MKGGGVARTGLALAASRERRVHGEDDNSDAFILHSHISGR
jgi:hypothetical protein